jgi:hypothetical protein
VGKIRRMGTADADAMYDIHVNTHSFQGLHKKASYATQLGGYQTHSDVFKDFFLSTCERPDYEYLGYFSDKGELLSFIKFNRWTQENGRKAVTMGIIMSTNKIALPKSHGGKYWNDTLIELINYAFDKFEAEGVMDWFTQRTLTNKAWVPITAAPGVKLGTYVSTMVEEIGFGTSDNPEFLKNVDNVSFSTRQGIFKLTKPGS